MDEVPQESSMLAEIREQSELLAIGLPRWREEIEQMAGPWSGHRLHLVGCGDMYFAAAQVAALCEEYGGPPVRAHRSMDLRWTHRHLTDRDLVVCASVSGRTPRTVEAALLSHRAGAQVLGVTDNAGSPLDEAIEQTLVLGTATAEELSDETYAGYRHIIAQTQTFSVVLLVELLLARAVTGIDLDLSGVPSRVAALAGTLDQPIRGLAAEFFDGGRQVVVLGSGPFRPTALYGAAKMLEFSVPSVVQCLEEFNHLESFVADATTRIVVLAADAASRARAAELTGAFEVVGARSLVLAPSGEYPGKETRVLDLPHGDLLDSVLSLVIAQQLLAAHGVAAMGRDPHRWLGGHRTEQVQAMSNQAIRGSRIWSPKT